MSSLSLADQRTAIYDALVSCGIGNVDKYARKDPIPPATMIVDPRIEFPDNSALGIVEWPVWMLAPRQAPAAVGDALDANLAKVLLAFSHGMRFGFVLRRVENIVRTIEGYPLPGYTIIGAAPLANC